MSLLNISLDDLVGTDAPELLFALVAPVGTPLDHLGEALKGLLVERGYEPRPLKLSDYLADEGLRLKTPPPEPTSTTYERYDALMRRGDELREAWQSGEALALNAAAEIARARPTIAEKSFGVHERKAFIVRQLKHPDEVRWLRAIYGHGFHLIGIHCPESVRRRHLIFEKHLSDDQAADLIARDKDEGTKWGQNVSGTFHHADVFVEVPRIEPEAVADAKEQLSRYLDALFGTALVTPTRTEFGMFMAHAAALRSADLSRQVGAAILTRTGETVSVGCNEVPAAGGGQYWGEAGTPDGRDYKRREDANERKRLAALAEVLSAQEPEAWAKLDEEGRQDWIRRTAAELKNTRLMNLTEFGRAVHAEMEAILAAARIGVSTRGKEMFATTFPCHNCAKHIVAAGLRRVVYIEPYPKSLAEELHDDAIEFGRPLEDSKVKTEDAEEEVFRKVRFEPFVGIAPSKYELLFSMLTQDGRRIRRKDGDGYFKLDNVGLRSFASPMSYVEREAAVAYAVDAHTKAQANTED